jgi:hypothetical protein
MLVISNGNKCEIDELLFNVIYYRVLNKTIFVRDDGNYEMITGYRAQHSHHRYQATFSVLFQFDPVLWIRIRSNTELFALAYPDPK